MDILTDDTADQCTLELTKQCEFCKKTITRSNLAKHLTVCKVRKDHLLKIEFKTLHDKYKDRIFELETKSKNDDKTIGILKEIIENMWKPSNHGFNHADVLN